MTWWSRVPLLAISVSRRVAARRWARVSDPATGPTAGLLNCITIQLRVADRGHSDSGRPAVGLCGSVGDRPQRIRGRLRRCETCEPKIALAHSGQIDSTQVIGCCLGERGVNGHPAA